MIQSTMIHSKLAIPIAYSSISPDWVIHFRHTVSVRAYCILWSQTHCFYDFVRVIIVIHNLLHYDEVEICFLCLKANFYTNSHSPACFSFTDKIGNEFSQIAANLKNEECTKKYRNTNNGIFNVTLTVDIERGIRRLFNTVNPTAFSSPNTARNKNQAARE